MPRVRGATRGNAGRPRPASHPPRPASGTGLLLCARPRGPTRPPSARAGDRTGQTLHATQPLHADGLEPAAGKPGNRRANQDGPDQRAARLLRRWLQPRPLRRGAPPSPHLAHPLSLPGTQRLAALQRGIRTSPGRGAATPDRTSHGRHRAGKGRDGRVCAGRARSPRCARGHPARERQPHLYRPTQARWPFLGALGFMGRVAVGIDRGTRLAPFPTPPPL